jgi:hypothetical protein
MLVAEEPPVLMHGAVVPNVEGRLGGKMTGGGLRPPAPSSNEPSGIPTRPTDDTEPIPAGDEADAAGPANELLPIVGQAPDAVPVMPPPSKTEVEPAVPAVDVPVIELPMPDIVFEPAAPKDVCGIEPPMPAHCAMTPVPDIAGLRPGDESPVAPSGMPVGATGEPGPMPSGEVMPRGEVPVAPTCATAEPPPNTAAVMTAIVNCLIIAVTCAARGRIQWLYATLR